MRIAIAFSTMPPSIFQEPVHCCSFGWIKVHHPTDKSLEVGFEAREAPLIPAGEELRRVVLVEATIQFDHSQALLLIVDVLQEAQEHWSEIRNHALQHFILRRHSLAQLVPLETKDVDSQHSVDTL
jgi:hypothetical protein